MEETFFINENYSQEHLQLILDNTDEGFVMLDRQLKIIAVNKRAQHISSIVLGKLFEKGKEILFFFDNERSEMQQIFKEVLEGAIHEKFIEATQNDTDFLIKICTKPLRNGRGKIAGCMLTFQDITEKNKTEKALKLSEEKYRLLFYHNPLPMWIYDIQTLRFLEVNDAAIDKYGYSRDEFLQMTIKDIRPEEQIPRLDHLLSQPRLEKLRQHGNWTHHKKNGALITVEIVSHFFNHSGIKAMLVLAHDITEKINAEKELRQSNERFELACKATSDAIWDWNLSASELSWGEGIEPMLGYKRSEIDKNDITQYVHADDSEYVVNKFTQMLARPEQTRTQFEFRMIKADGGIINVLNRALVMRDEHDKPCRVIGSFQDITQLKVHEQELQQYAGRINEILESINDGFFATDRNFVVTYWNKKAEQLLNIPRGEITGKNLQEFFSKEITSFHSEAAKALEINSSVQFEVYSAPLNSWFEYSIYPSAGSLSVYFKDVTERKQAELKLKRLNKQLEQQAASLTASNRELEQFAYIASHDLQEPLRMVSSFLILLEKRLEGKLDETTRQYFHFVMDGSERMKTLIQDLLLYSRAANNKEALTRVDLNQTLQYVLNVHHEAIEQNRATLRVQPLPVVLANKTQMSQLFQNLLGNALKYRSQTDDPVIEIGCREENEAWTFFVKDNGIGIDPKFFDKIFIIFQRLHNKSQYAGTGIGLAVCKKIVERHGGSIWVESTPGNGSTFYFTLKKQIHD